MSNSNPLFEERIELNGVDPDQLVQELPSPAPPPKPSAVPTTGFRVYWEGVRTGETPPEADPRGWGPGHAADLLGLDLRKAVGRACHAVARTDGRRVLIRTIQTPDPLELATEPTVHLVVVFLDWERGEIEIVWNGPGPMVWSAAGLTQHGRRVTVDELRSLSSPDRLPHARPG